MAKVVKEGHKLGLLFPSIRPLILGNTKRAELKEIFEGVGGVFHVG